MCTVRIKIDELLLHKYMPELSDKEAISKWAQDLIDKQLEELQKQKAPTFIEIDIDSL